MNDRLFRESDILKAVDKRIEELSKDPVFIRKNGQIDLYGIKKYLLAIPTAEWPQGEWIDQGWHGDWQFETDGRGNCWHEYECSECGFHSKGSKSKYCPNCGTRMKGVGDEGNNK